MPEKFLAIENFELKNGSEVFSIIRGESYSKKELVKFLEKEGALKFKLKCTKLKNVLIEFDKDAQEVIKNEIKETTSEETTSEETTSEETTSEETTNIEMMFLSNKQIKKDNKIIFKKGQKINVSELEGFDVASLIDQGFLTEIKIKGSTEAKD